MEEKELERLYPTILLAILCASVPKSAFGGGSEWWNCFLFHFSHANVWHFLANFTVIAQFKPRWGSLLPAYLSASAAALMPFAGVNLPTCGISAMIFAMLARRDAILGIWNWQLVLVNLIIGLIPAYNWRIHLISYIISFILWKTIAYTKAHSRRRN